MKVLRLYIVFILLQLRSETQPFGSSTSLNEHGYFY